MIHIDIKKLGRIDGIGHRITGDRTGQSNRRATGRGLGWEYVHVAVDDASRMAYTEILPGERKENAVAFTTRAIDWFAQHKVQVERIMSDNGGYRGHGLDHQRVFVSGQRRRVTPRSAAS